METATDVINDALQAIVVQASEQPIQTVDFQTARRYLNRMMATVPFVGLGFTNINLPDDLVTVPDAALEGVVFNLAVKLLATYDMPLTAELSQNARDGLKEIRRLTVNVEPTQFSCTLPIGSGNDLYNPVSDFFPCPDDELLTEQGGSILLESDT
jgi:hypothetical protein